MQALPATKTPFQEALAWIKQTTGLADERLARLLGVLQQALHGWRRAAPMSAPHRQRLLAVRELLQRAARRHATPEQLVACDELATLLTEKPEPAGTRPLSSSWRGWRCQGAPMGGPRRS